MRLCETQTNNRPARYYIDGRRVSQETYEETIIKANIQGKQRDTFYTQLKGDKTKFFSSIR